MVAEKKLISQISYFGATTAKPSNQVMMKEAEVKKVGWRRDMWRRDRCSKDMWWRGFEKVKEGYVE